MSMAIAHFSFGATMTTLVTLLLPRIRYPRTLVLVGGGWAMLPDVHRISPVAAERLHELHRSSPAADLFWFHRTLDRLDPADTEEVAAGFVALFVLVTSFAEWRGYRTPERVREAYETRLGVEPAK